MVSAMLKQVIQHFVQVTRGCDMIKDLSINEELISCDICGDCHEIDNVPWGCQTGDG